MTYIEYKQQRQNEFNALPVFYAFSDEQFDRALEDRHLTREQAKTALCRFWGGGFYLRSDRDQIFNWIKSDRLSELMKDPKFAEDAFLYEMNNHEYAINWEGDWDVCNCFGNCKYSEDKSYIDYLNELGFDDAIISAYGRARVKHMKIAERW